MTPLKDCFNARRHHVAGQHRRVARVDAKDDDDDDNDVDGDAGDSHIGDDQRMSKSQRIFPSKLLLFRRSNTNLSSILQGKSGQPLEANGLTKKRLVGFA